MGLGGTGWTTYNTMPANVLLVSSSFEEVSLVTASLNREHGAKTSDSSHYSLGIAYLHAYLESKGHDTRSLFLNNYGFESCLEMVDNAIEQSRPTIVG